MKIKLLKDQTWSVGVFKKDQILEVGIDVPEKIGIAMIENKYAEELGVKSRPSPVVQNKSVNPVEETQVLDPAVENKSGEFADELLEKIQSMTKKELVVYAMRNKIKLNKNDVKKSDIFKKVLKFLEGRK